MGPATWQEVTAADIGGVAFERLPEDTGVVAPIAGPDDEPDAEMADQLEKLGAALPTWPPGQVRDVVQRVRNYLFAAAVADVYRLDPLERFVPLAVFERIQVSVPASDLPKILYFVALHPQDGSDSAARQLHQLGLPDGPPDTAKLRNRATDPTRALQRADSAQGDHDRSTAELEAIRASPVRGSCKHQSTNRATGARAVGFVHDANRSVRYARDLTKAAAAACSTHANAGTAAARH